MCVCVCVCVCVILKVTFLINNKQGCGSVKQKYIRKNNATSWAGYANFCEHLIQISLESPLIYVLSEYILANAVKAVQDNLLQSTNVSLLQ